jgi:hypothetical protein
MTGVNLIFVIILIVAMVYFGKGCISCEENSNQQKTQMIVNQPKKQVPVQKNVKQTSSKIEAPKTWSQLLKNKPKEMQIKQEELKKAMRKISIQK